MVSKEKVKFKPSTKSDKEGCLYFEITHSRRVRLIRTSYNLDASEWNEKTESVVLSVGDPSRRRLLESIQKRVGWDVQRLRRIIARFVQSDESFSSEDIISEFRRQTAQSSLRKLVEDIICDNEALGHERTAETYVSMLNSFMRFMEGEDVPIDGIDSQLVQQYEAWLKSTGVTPNSSSFYLKRLRAAYNVAVERGLTIQKHPFRHVYTGKEKTAKRAVKFSIIKKVKSLDLESDPSLDLARDLFLFSFYTRGMSFIDMSYLKASNLQSGYLVYRRHKTGKRLYIKWEDCMKQLVDKYAGSPTGYLLPIITAAGNERQQYIHAQYRVNYYLKRLSEKAGICPALTLYVARHSWASIARESNPISLVSEALGHESEQTTRIYLAELDASFVDNANKKILDKL